MAIRSSDEFPWRLGSFRFTAFVGEPKRPKPRQMVWVARVAVRHDSTEASSVGIDRFLLRTLDERTPWKVTLFNFEPVQVFVRDLPLSVVRHRDPQEVGFACGWQCRTTDEIETKRRKSWTGPKSLFRIILVRFGATHWLLRLRRRR